MGWFNRKKTKNQPESVSAAQEEEIQIAKDMRNIDKASQTLAELDTMLEGMWTGTFRNNVLKAAEQNQKKIQNFDKLYQKVTAEMAADNDNAGIDAMLREKEAIEGLTIQYQNTKMEDAYQDGENRLYFVEEEAADYQEIPAIMKEALKSYTPADVNRYQAADILPKLEYFFKEMESALESGQKLKADVCKIIFSYVMNVLLRIEPIGSEEKIQKELEFRQKTMTEQFRSIIDAVDKIYNLVTDLKSYEMQLHNNKNDYRNLKRQKEKMPVDLLNTIDKLGFANAIKKDPDNALIYECQSLFNQMRTTITTIRTTELYRDNCRDTLCVLEQQLGQMLYVVMRNFNTQGKNVSMEVLSNVLDQATQSTIAQIQRDNAALHAYFTRMNEIDSQVTALRADMILANVATDSAARIAAYEKVEERRKEVNQQIAARSRELEAEAQTAVNQESQQNVHSNRILADM